MIRTILFIPRLVLAVAYVGIILTAKPLLALLREEPRRRKGRAMDIDTLLSSYPGPRGHYDAAATEGDMLMDLREWAEAARETLESMRPTSEVPEPTAESTGEASEPLPQGTARSTKSSSPMSSARSSSFLLPEATSLLTLEQHLLAETLCDVETALDDAGVPREVERPGEQTRQLNPGDRVHWLALELGNALLEAKEQAKRAEDAEKQLIHRDAYIDALEQDVEMLETHIDSVDEVARFDAWAGWDEEAR